MTTTSAIFRSKVASQGAKTNVVPAAKKSVADVTPNTDFTEVPPTQYQDFHNKPYIADVLELNNVYDELDSDFKFDMEEIDNYFSKEVKRKKYENNSEGYKAYLKKLVKITDTKDKPKRAKYGKIAEFIRYVRRTERF